MNIRTVSRGDRYTRTCTTSVGFKSSPTPEAGLVFDFGDHEAFVAWSEIDRLRASLLSRSTERRAAIMLDLKKGKR